MTKQGEERKGKILKIVEKQILKFQTSIIWK